MQPHSFLGPTVEIAALNPAVAKNPQTTGRTWNKKVLAGWGPNHSAMQTHSFPRCTLETAALNPTLAQQLQLNSQMTGRTWKILAGWSPNSAMDSHSFPGRAVETAA